MPAADANNSTGPQCLLDAPPVVQTVRLPLTEIDLPGNLVIPVGARGLVLSMLKHRCAADDSTDLPAARQFEHRGLATLFFQLPAPAMSESDAPTNDFGFDLLILAHRLLQATRWAMHDPRTRDLGIGYLATGMGAAAALVAAAQMGYAVQAVVAYAGLPDAAGHALEQVTAPTLLIVGDHDRDLLHFNRTACDRLVCRKELAVIPKAGLAFEAARAQEQAGTLAADWFRDWLRPIQRL